MSTINVNQMVDSQGGVLAPISSVMRNRIINGQMTIDQRNAGASVSTGSGTYGPYTLDRWAIAGSGGGVFSYQQSSVAPAGFVNSALITVTTADSSIAAGDYYQFRQAIEGFNVSDLGWGTANAQTITLSFWVRSSLTGTFGLSLRNGNGDRSYVATYAINSANTWEQKTVTIPGDTAGTWTLSTTVGMYVTFSLGVGSSFESTANSWQAGNFVATSGSVDLVGTNGATFYITGVQLEKGTQATSFEYRQYGQELALCQRYYQTSYPYGTAVDAATGPTEGASFICINTSDSSNGGLLPVTMRATPTFAMYSTVGGAGSPSARNNASGASVTGITLNGGITTSLPRLTKGGGLSAVGTPYSAHYTASAEL